LANLVTSGDYYYCTCGSGTNENKINIFTRASATSITGPTTVGGSGSPNYTGVGGLSTITGYMVNGGVGLSGNQYSVSYWDISTPATPTLVDVMNDELGVLANLAVAGSIIIGVDVDNTQLKMITTASAEWSMSVRFYNAADELVGTNVVYEGDSDNPVTTENWCLFSKTIPLGDIPSVATQLDVLLETNTGTDAVYVDALSIVSSETE